MDKACQRMMASIVGGLAKVVELLNAERAVYSEKSFDNRNHRVEGFERPFVKGELIRRLKCDEKNQVF